MRYLVYARYMYRYENGEIILVDLAPESSRKTDTVFIVHEELAIPDVEPIGVVETVDSLLTGYIESALCVTQASEILAAIAADEAGAAV